MYNYASDPGYSFISARSGLLLFDPEVISFEPHIKKIISSAMDSYGRDDLLYPLIMDKFHMFTRDPEDVGIGFSFLAYQLRVKWVITIVEVLINNALLDEFFLNYAEIIETMLYKSIPISKLHGIFRVGNDGNTAFHLANAVIFNGMDENYSTKDVLFHYQRIHDIYVEFGTYFADSKYILGAMNDNGETVENHLNMCLENTLQGRTDG
jgi:hypothetical protein